MIPHIVDLGQPRLGSVMMIAAVTALVGGATAAHPAQAPPTEAPSPARPARTFTAAPLPCTSAMNCSLNGACAAGLCVCDAPWTGSSCSILDMLPVAYPQGYGMSPKMQHGVNSSWGAQILQDSAGTYHIFVNVIAGQCLLNTWGRSSRVDHGVSPNATGPFTYVGQALDTFASNPAVIVLSDASPFKYAMFHIGNGSGSAPTNCTAGPAAAAAADASNFGAVEWVDRTRSAGAALFDSNAISVATSFNGPWVPLEGNTLPSCNNPAPMSHPNGTLYAFCSDQLYRADHLTGPWSKVGRAISHTGSGSPADVHFEDPHLYTNARGFHLLFHASNHDENPPLGHECRNSTVSAHLFSPDGFVWRVSETQPYTTEVEVRVPGGGTKVVVVATRERPKLLFDTRGRPTHLINGVSGVSSCTDSPRTGCVDCKYRHWAYTLVQPLNVN